MQRLEVYIKVPIFPAKGSALHFKKSKISILYKIATGVRYAILLGIKTYFFEPSHHHELIYPSIKL